MDKQDFNCPIAYDFDADHLMWYQRKPLDNEFVDLVKGWQGISIPFTAELVTTDEKGEITHFYNDGGGNSKGHEYWLRQLTDGGTMTLKSGETKVLKATFHYPNATSAAKTVDNTFLWDYYYQNVGNHNQKDKNSDTYLEYRQYYKNARTYTGYPVLTKATPYILGLPGKTYYEFDLSGKFDAQTTASPKPKKLAKQIITFASNKREHIGVSDEEMTGTKVTYGGNKFYFKPSYLNSPTIETGKHAFLLNADGNSYVETDAATPALDAFRPYFLATATVAEPSREATRSIIFSRDETNETIKPIETHEANEPGTLIVIGGKHLITVKSGLKVTTTVRIVNANGITLNTFDIEPGETIETRVNLSGVYMVQTVDGKFIKKISVR